jgi:hypothetical protein
LQDLGGQTSIRPYWRCYYANTAAVIFVIDSTDVDRLQTASEELAAMLNEEELRDAALLVFANKQDQPGAKGAGEISEALKLGELRDRNWSIVACSAIDGRGVDEGMDWMVVSSELRGSGPVAASADSVSCSKRYRTRIPNLEPFSPWNFFCRRWGGFSLDWRGEHAFDESSWLEFGALYNSWAGSFLSPGLPKSIAATVQMQHNRTIHLPVYHA